MMASPASSNAPYSKKNGHIPGDRWTGTLILLRFEEAAETLRRLPPAVRRGKVTSWPDYVRGASGEAPRVPLRLMARPEAIDRLDETMIWLGWLPGLTARIAWARVNKASWRQIATLAGMSPRTCQRRLTEGLLEIAARLNKMGVRA